jgi:phosphatidylserine/phosphatidylglycerophosphate/cardiolipin synthase-like enzyme
MAFLKGSELSEDSSFHSIAHILSPVQLEIVGRGLKSGQPMAMVLSALPKSKQNEARRLLSEIEKSIDKKIIGITLEAMSSAARRAISEIEVVWSGPTPHAAMGRTTWGVLNEVVESAKEYIYAATYSAGVNSPALVALKSALDRGIEITCLLDIHHRGDDSAKIVMTQLKGARFLALAKDDKQFAAMMHAKYIVVDGNYTFLTSANFSNIAVDKSLEVGLLVSNSFIASQFKRRIDDLLQEGFLVQVK